MIRLYIRKLLQKVGYDIVKYHPAYVVGRFDEPNLEGEYEWLRRFSFKTIIDIGANEGQFADKMSTLFPDSLIYSFEPIPEAFERLESNFEKRTNIRLFNIALGDQMGQLTLNVNESTASSSFLTMSALHQKSFDFAVETKPLTVEVATLDSTLPIESISKPLLVKIDVQGFENKVIAGGMHLLKEADVILCEVSFKELYKGQPLFHDIYSSLRSIGFEYSGSTGQLRSPETNAILQADAVFINRNSH